jgi:hypothetical protein
MLAKLDNTKLVLRTEMPRIYDVSRALDHLTWASVNIQQAIDAIKSNQSTNPQLPKEGE